jgi:hypothetical protein
VSPRRETPLESASRAYRESLQLARDVTQRAIAGDTPAIAEILDAARELERAGFLCQVVADMRGPSEALFATAKDLRLAAAMYRRVEGAAEVEA